MAIKQEEVRLRVAVDSSQVSVGMTKMSQQVNKFVNDTGKKLLSLAKTNIWLAGADLLRQAIPSAEEFWNRVYGVSEDQTRAYESQLNRLRRLRTEVLETKARLDAAYTNRNLKSADNLGKEAIYEAEMFDIDAGMNKARDQVKLLKDTKQPVEEIVKAEQNLRNLQLQRLETQEKLSDLREKMSPEELRSSIQRRANRIGEVKQLRTDLETFQMLGDKAGESKARRRIDEIIRERNQLEGLPEGVGVNAFLASTNPLKPFTPPNAANSAEIESAFTKAIKENTLYVLIKGVEGE